MSSLKGKHAREYDEDEPSFELCTPLLTLPCIWPFYSNPDINSAALREVLTFHVQKFPALLPNLIVSCLYSPNVTKMTRHELQQRLKDDGIRREQIGSETKVVSGNGKKYVIVPDSDNWDQFFVYDISVSVTRDDVDVTRGYLFRNMSFIGVNRSSNTSRAIARFFKAYHASRFVSSVDLANINDSSDGTSLMVQDTSYSWNHLPPSTPITALNDMFAFRRRLFVSNKVCQFHADK